MTAKQRDLMSGLMFLVFGCLGFYLSLSYSWTFRNQIGPAVFPALLTGLLVPLGIAQCIIAIRRGGSELVDRFHLRPILVVTLSVVVFGLLCTHAGIGIAMAAAAFIAAFARTGVDKRKAAAAFVVITAIVYLVLIQLIGLRLSLFP
jgi:hypothetical protein